jgi:heavy metal sensor kinase
MNIRTKLTLWYAAILFVSLAVLTAVLNYEWTDLQRFLPADKQDTEPVWEEMGEVVLFYGVPSGLLMLLGGWWLMSKALGPVAALIQAAERIHLHNLKERLPSTGNGDELDRLTEVFNAMTGRLDAAFTRVREFTLHASHELKTPLTILRGEMETMMRDDATPPAHREHLSSQLEEIQRLTKIVDGLTFLAKADAGQAVLKLEPVRLDELVRDIFADAQLLARGQRIAVTLAKCDETIVHGDSHRLRQLLLNLADNAIKYNQPEGHMDIALTRHADSAVLTVSNTGSGIGPEKLARVFDRFYRGDPAHNSDVEGCGLGLAIAQWIVQAHGGAISIASESSQPTTVTVRLPAANPPPVQVTRKKTNPKLEVTLPQP